MNDNLATAFLTSPCHETGSVLVVGGERSLISTGVVPPHPGEECA